MTKCTGDRPNLARLDSRFIQAETGRHGSARWHFKFRSYLGLQSPILRTLCEAQMMLLYSS